ncbi:phosphonate C-P lyase system protein PhnG [Sabulicella glaciei]|uniref:Phosphonate C-P lyase system protein PhnG n=1 Tax=Sabulicella glaciei TaxID=2984948 RepID=A0ABT3NTQ6_9PROT|nr:phosphonate C-P lyase system protein PhnG [Roseococcus sp. MDT2-1-1]MCW8084939.1 phosphonate C-P lyase system protein PhnG [Roseococcus sp. MDT2-1-1]
MATRPEWISVLARASAEEIGSLAGPLPPYRRLRGPETGLTMLRGRAGGAGAVFNLGEATATRCTVALPDGTLGHGWRLGRDRHAAEVAAVMDALLQGAEGEAWHARVVAPLAEAQRAAREQKSRRAAATAVRFSTLGTMR